MKYNHLLLISIIISSVVSGMEIERSIKRKALDKWVYREKMTITFTSQINDEHDKSIKLIDQHTDQTNDDHDTSITLTKRSSSGGLEKKKNFERY